MSCLICQKNHKSFSAAGARCQKIINRVLEEAPPKAERQRLEGERPGITHRFLIGEMKGYATVSTYPDGRPGELFFKMDRQGSTISGLGDSWAIAVSMLLQQGVPLRTITDKFKSMRFEPEGMTDSPEIRIAQSPVDYIARWMEMRFGPV